jgi:hypothetical protein
MNATSKILSISQNGILNNLKFWITQNNVSKEKQRNGTVEKL